MWSGMFWKAAAERAVRAAAAAMLATLGTDVTFAEFQASWQQLFFVGAAAALVSLLLSITATSVTGSAGPSLTNTEVLPAEK